MASQRLLSCCMLWTHVLVLGTSASTPHQGSQLHTSVHFHMMRWSALCLSITDTETKESCCEDYYFYRCSWGCGHYLDFSVTRSPGTLGKDSSTASKTQPSQDRILWGESSTCRVTGVHEWWAADVYTQRFVNWVSRRCVHSTLRLWTESSSCCVTGVHRQCELQVCTLNSLCLWMEWGASVLHMFREDSMIEACLCVSCIRLMFTTRGWDTSARARQWSKLLISDVLHTLGWCPRAHSFPHHRVVCIWKCIAQKSPSSLYLIIVHLPPPHPTPHYSSSHLVPFIMMTQDFVTLGPSHSFSIEWNDPFVL